MAVSKSKRNKAYRPKPVKVNPMQVAMNLVGTLTDDERRQIMVPTKLALEKLRIGTAGQEQWEHLANAANIGLELAHLGVCSDSESVAMLTNMLLALGAICQRVNAGGSFTPKGIELTAITDGVYRHDIQLKYASCRDLQKAVQSFEASKELARAGRIPSLSLTGRELVAA